MREILFRGKRLDNGEWIEGHIIQYEDRRARICESHTDIFCYEKDRSIIQTVAHEVDPSTVCQYTGLKDKNGKKVFEGDIIKKTNKGRHPQIFTANIHTHFCVNEEVYYSPCDHFTECCEYEIIGNIHDNPEFLKMS